MFRTLQKQRGYDDHGWHPDGYKIELVGDIIDGASAEDQIETVKHLMDMHSRGNLISHPGNHEFNAIAYATEGRNGYIRAHTEENYGYQKEFLTAFPFGSPGNAEIVSWFKSFPLYSRNNGYNIIHACWNDNAINVCGPYLDEHSALTEDAYQQFDLRNGNPVYEALQLMLWGPTYRMPKGVTIEDSKGRFIDYSRFGWWTDPRVPSEEVFYRGSSFLPRLAEEEKGKISKMRQDFQYAGQNVVFVGHYCMPYQPGILSPKVACLDFKDHMTAYRWDEGDRALNPAKLVCV